MPGFYLGIWKGTKYKLERKRGKPSQSRNYPAKMYFLHDGSQTAQRICFQLHQLGWQSTWVFSISTSNILHILSVTASLSCRGCPASGYQIRSSNVYFLQHLGIVDLQLEPACTLSKVHCSEWLKGHSTMDMDTRITCCSTAWLLENSTETNIAFREQRISTSLSGNFQVWTF